MFSDINDNYYNVISTSDHSEVAIDSADTSIKNVIDDNSSVEKKVVKTMPRDKKIKLCKIRKKLQKTESSFNPCPIGRHLESHPVTDLDAENIGLPAVASSLLAACTGGIREGLFDNSLSENFSISRTNQKKRTKVK